MSTEIRACKATDSIAEVEATMRSAVSGDLHTIQRIVLIGAT